MEWLIFYCKTCISSDCNLTASHKFPNEQLLYCTKHKLDGMISTKQLICIHNDCKTIAYFNMPNKTKALYCTKHKLNGMVNIKSKTCIIDDCKTTKL